MAEKGVILKIVLMSTAPYAFCVFIYYLMLRCSFLEHVWCGIECVDECKGCKQFLQTKTRWWIMVFWEHRDMYYCWFFIVGFVKCVLYIKVITLTLLWLLDITLTLGDLPAWAVSFSWIGTNDNVFCDTLCLPHLSHWHTLSGISVSKTDTLA